MIDRAHDRGRAASPGASIAPSPPRPRRSGARPSPQPHRTPRPSAGWASTCAGAKSAMPCSLQDFARQIEPPAPGILGQVAQDVGELQGAAERMRDTVGGGRIIAEDAHREPPDRARHAVAIKVEHCRGSARRSASRASISMPSTRARKSSCAQPVLRGDRGEHAGERQRRMAGEERGHFRAPLRERRELRLGRVVAVGDVVDDAAKGIDREHRIAPRRRQQPHRPIERACRRQSPGRGSPPRVASTLGVQRARSRSASQEARQEGRGEIGARQLHPHRQRIAAPQPPRQPLRQLHDDRTFMPQPAACDCRRQQSRLRDQPLGAVEQAVDRRPQARARLRRAELVDRVHRRRQARRSGR